MTNKHTLNRSAKLARQQAIIARWYAHNVQSHMYFAKYLIILSCIIVTVLYSLPIVAEVIW